MEVASSHRSRSFCAWAAASTGAGFFTGTMVSSLMIGRLFAGAGWGRGLLMAALCCVSLVSGLTCLLAEHDNVRAFHWKSAVGMFCVYAALSAALPFALPLFVALGIGRHIVEANARRRMNQTPAPVMRLTTRTYEDANPLVLVETNAPCEDAEPPLQKAA